jgi:hypothetical protein
VKWMISAKHLFQNGKKLNSMRAVKKDAELEA